MMNFVEVGKTDFTNPDLIANSFVKHEIVVISQDILGVTSFSFLL